MCSVQSGANRPWSAAEAGPVQPPATVAGELTTLRSLVGSSSGLIYEHMESRMSTEPAASLKDAYLNLAPRGSGVWKLFLNGKLMTLGQAKDGLRKRFSDFYRGKPGGTAGKKEIDGSNKDQVTVWWRECPPDDCERYFEQMYVACEEAGEVLPWLRRRPSRKRLEKYVVP